MSSTLWRKQIYSSQAGFYDFELRLWFLEGWKWRFSAMLKGEMAVFCGKLSPRDGSFALCRPEYRSLWRLEAKWVNWENFSEFHIYTIVRLGKINYRLLVICRREHYFAANMKDYRLANTFFHSFPFVFIIVKILSKHAFKFNYVKIYYFYVENVKSNWNFFVSMQINCEIFPFFLVLP